MAMALLGDQIDIHTGGVDNLFPHHEDERAQSEAASGRQFVKYWIHCAHLLFGEEKMSKSLGNITTLSGLMERGIRPLAFRFFVLQGHYRKQLNMTDDAIEGAQTGLNRMWDQIAELGQAQEENDDGGGEDLRLAFLQAINDDLGTPRALSVVQHVLESKLSPRTKLTLLADMDRVLGLDLIREAGARSTLSPEQQALVSERQEARNARDWQRSDQLRQQLAESGVEVRDVPGSQRWLRRS